MYLVTTVVVYCPVGRLHHSLLMVCSREELVAQALMADSFTSPVRWWLVEKLAYQFSREQGTFTPRPEVFIQNAQPLDTSFSAQFIVSGCNNARKDHGVIEMRSTIRGEDLNPKHMPSR